MSANGPVSPAERTKAQKGLRDRESELGAELSSRVAATIASAAVAAINFEANVEQGHKSGKRFIANRATWRR